MRPDASRCNQSTFNEGALGHHIAQGWSMCNSDRLVIQESEGFRLVSGNAEIQERSEFALTVMRRDSGRDGDGP